MNENEKRITEKLAEQVPALNEERLARLALIMEVAAMVLDAHEEKQEQRAAAAAAAAAAGRRAK